MSASVITAHELAATPELATLHSPLLGRDSDVAAVLDLLERDRARLITLTGTGGVGKTRLALQVARQARETFPGGVYTVPAASILEPQRLPAAILQALMARESGAGSEAAAIVDAIGPRRVLLVLDNLEQILGAGPMLSEVLAACPNLVVLVTSRVPLRLSGEIEYPVRSLEAPRPESASLDQLRANAAVQLFVERAQSVRPGFALTHENAEAIAEIARRLDGLPLALELAAARVKVLSPQALLTRLAHSLQILTGGPRDAPARLRSMRDAIGWSYELLDDELRTFFRALGVFVGGFSLDAAAAVGAGGDEDLALEQLSALVDHNLVISTPTENEEPRFGMLETIREFALESLTSAGELDGTQARQADWVYQWITDSARSFFGPEESRTMDRIEEDAGNLRAAIPVMIERDAERAAELLYDAWYFWGVRGHYREGLDWLARSEPKRGEVSERAIAKLELATGFLRWAIGDYERSVALIESAKATFEKNSDEVFVAICRFGLGSVYRDRDESERAEAELQQSLEVFERHGERAWMGFCLSVLGAVARQTGRYDEAVDLLERGLKITRSINFPGGILPLLDHLGDIAREQGDHARALELYRQTLRLWLDQRDPHAASDSVAGFGASLEALGDAEEATRLLGAAAATYEKLGFPRSRYSKALNDDALARLRATLGDGAYDTAWSEGRQLSLDEAMTRALEYEPAPDRAPAGRVMHEAGRATGGDWGLTAREMEILDLLIEGKTNVEIGEAVFISPRTAGTHITNIFNKMGVSSRSAAVSMAMRSRRAVRQ